MATTSQRELLCAVTHAVNYWRNTQPNEEDEESKADPIKWKLEGLAFSILCMLDGVSGSIDLKTVHEALNSGDDSLMLHELY
jgi:hypothetical protein